MSVPDVGPASIPDWSNSAVDSVATDNTVPSPQAPANATAQNAASAETGSIDPALAGPRKAEASVDASAMKATVNVIPINQPPVQKRDYAAEAKARWETNSSPKQKWEAANNPTPPLKPFIGDHEKAVNEGAFEKLPLVGDVAKLGRHIVEFATGTDGAGNTIDRREKSREISREILSEAAGHLAGEAVGEFYGEAISEVAGKGAGFVANQAVDQVVDTGISKITEAATQHIAGDDAEK